MNKAAHQLQHGVQYSNISSHPVLECEENPKLDIFRSII